MRTGPSSTWCPASWHQAGRIYPVGRLDRDSEGCCCSPTTATGRSACCIPATASSASTPAGVREPLVGDQVGALLKGVTLEEGVARVVSIRHQTDIETRRLLTALGDRAHPADRLTWYRVDPDPGLEAPDPADVPGGRVVRGAAGAGAHRHRAPGRAGRRARSGS